MNKDVNIYTYRALETELETQFFTFYNLVGALIQ